MLDTEVIVMKTKGFYISLMAGAICIVAAAAICLNTFGKNDINDNKQLENDNYGEQVAENEDDFYIPKVITEAPVSPTKAPEIKHKENKTKKKEDKKTNEDEKSEDVGIAVMDSGKSVSNLSFNQEKGIMWPVSGEVLMKYSADKAVYFKTLGQYKTNPALIISAEKGTSVASAVESVVTKVGENEEIGKYVETSLGDNYKIIYGQLDNIQVQKGDSLAEGEIIGVIAEPTKYYVDEGSNLYMEMLSGKENVDPLIFLR